LFNLLGLFILLLFSAFFSCSETALTAVSKLRLMHLVEEKRRGAQLLAHLRKDPSRLLTTLLVGNNIVNTWASVLAASVAFEYFKGFTSFNTSLVVGLVTGIMTLLILLFGEITPKTIAFHNAEAIALFISPVIVALEYLLQPVIWLLNFIIRPLTIFFKGPGEKALTIEEVRMISSIYNLGDTSAGEIMTPRDKVKAAEVNMSIEALLGIIAEVRHSRIPIYEGTIDNIIGVVYTKDLIIKKGETIRDYIQPILSVPDSKKVDELMRQMQRARGHIAEVVDKNGVTLGIVTLEDVIEEIVGEIYDEFEGIDRIKTNELEK